MARRTSFRNNATTQFSSDRYHAFAPWQKIVFWLGILWFVHPVYWLVRLILYLVLQKTPFQKRLDAYAMQTLVFGAILGIMIMIGLLVFLAILPVMTVVSLVN